MTNRAYTNPRSVGREYDQWTTDGILEHFWGEHIHHGYYPRGTTVDVDFKQAKVDMVERLLAWGKVGSPHNILDVGCGIGGSSRHLCRQYRASVTGVTLSPGQKARAEELSHEQNLSEHVQVRIADALSLPFPDDHFDLIWSCESAEHMPDKPSFIREMTRVLKPGGCLLIATWCHRDNPLSHWEHRLLKRIYDEWALPYFVPLSTYDYLARKQGLTAVQTEDWSLQAAPTWKHQIREGLGSLSFLLRQPRSVLARSLKDCLAVSLMILGYRTGTIRYGLMRATKP